MGIKPHRIDFNTVNLVANTVIVCFIIIKHRGGNIILFAAEILLHKSVRIYKERVNNGNRKEKYTYDCCRRYSFKQKRHNDNCVHSEQHEYYFIEKVMLCRPHACKDTCHKRAARPYRRTLYFIRICVVYHFQ